MANKNVMLAGKKVGVAWENALIVDGGFSRAFVVPTLKDVVFDSFATAVDGLTDMVEGTMYTITLNVLPHENTV